MKAAPASLKDALQARLAYNEPVLAHLPEVRRHADRIPQIIIKFPLQALALLAAPESGIPPIDPMPALKHAARIADEACYVAGDQSLRVSACLFFLSLSLCITDSLFQLSWYTKRASLIGIYSAAGGH
jgi:ubiquinone biosynthesis protein COQ9